MVNQEEIHKMAQSEDAKERSEAINQLSINFANLPDKNKAWADLKKLTLDKTVYVRHNAVYSFGIVFRHIPDKKHAWTDLHGLVWNKDRFVRQGVAHALGYAYPYIPDKKQAWADLHRLTQDKSSHVRNSAAISLCPYIFDWKQAREDLYKLLQDKKSVVQWGATVSLGALFPYLRNKKQAWKNLHLLTLSKNAVVRMRAAQALETAFPHVPAKKQAWADLHRLTLDKKSSVRSGAAYSIGEALAHVYDKKQAWADLQRLMLDTYSSVRWCATHSIGMAFTHIPDRKKAWEKLHRMTMDKKNVVRWHAAISLCSVFPYILDKEEAWNDLIRLALDNDSIVRLQVAISLSLVFPYSRDREQVWEELIRLTHDEEGMVRASASYSLGKASIFKAIETENKNNFREELENALKFFEQSTNETTDFNPAYFCLPFYRSLYSITFKKQEAEVEVQKYLAEARSTVEGSESQVKLLEVIENLSNALKEAQKTQKMGFDDMKCNLNAYRIYCERAASLLNTTEEKAPTATKLIRKGLPIIDQKIKELLGEIEEKARKFCKDSRETPFEKISRNAYEHVKGLGETENPIKAEISLNGLAPLLRSMCRILPEESKNVICSQLDEIEEAELSEKARIIGGALSSIQPQIINLQEKLAERERWIEYFKNMVIQRLDNINYGVFQLKIRSGEIVPKLHEIQHELKKLIIIKTDLDNIGLNIKDFGNLQHHDIQKLNDGITLLCIKIETEIIPKLPKANDAHRIIEIQKKIQDLKQSKEEIWFNRVAGLSSIVGLILTIL